MSSAPNRHKSNPAPRHFISGTQLQLGKSAKAKIKINQETPPGTMFPPPGVKHKNPPKKKFAKFPRKYYICVAKAQKQIVHGQSVKIVLKSSENLEKRQTLS